MQYVNSNLHPLSKADENDRLITKPLCKHYKDKIGISQYRRGDLYAGKVRRLNLAISKHGDRRSFFLVNFAEMQVIFLKYL